MICVVQVYTKVYSFNLKQTLVLSSFWEHFEVIVLTGICEFIAFTLFLIMIDSFSLDEVEVVWFQSAKALSLVSLGRGGGDWTKNSPLKFLPPSDLRVTQFACLDSGQGESWKKCSRNLNFSQQPEKCWVNWGYNV